MKLLFQFIRAFAAAAAIMYGYAWYALPQSLFLEHALVVEGKVSVSTSRQREQLQIDTGSRVHRSSCLRAQTVCRLALERPGTPVRAWILESAFRDEDWLIRVDVGDRTVLSIDEQQTRFEPYRVRAGWLAVGSAAIAAMLLLPWRRRPRHAA